MHGRLWLGLPCERAFGDQAVRAESQRERESALFPLAGMGARRKAVLRTRRADDVIEAHKVDGAWVAYGWERPGR